MLDRHAAMDASATRPPLSVVVANTQAWPEIEPCLAALLPQIRRLGAELIVADGGDPGLPMGDEASSEFRCLPLAGASPYQLRAAGMAAARGEIVAVTEDHCRVRPDWCERVLEAHRRWPQAAVIGGAVENGATGRLIDWATFFVANGAWLLPIPTGPCDSVSGQANISYKRRAVPDRYPSVGVVEADLQRELRARAEMVVADDGMVVDHVQSLGARGTLAVNFHNGRCQAGFALVRLTAVARLRRIAAMVLAPARIGIDTCRIVLRIAIRKRRHRREAILAAPLVALVLAAHVAGEAIGLLRGPGGSPRHMR
jgi:hypothetical protein